MAQNTDDPVELFDLHISHVGINTNSPEEAEAVAKEFEDLMGLMRIHTAPVSTFAGTLIEVMNNGGRGEKGHIGFYVNDIPAAEKWFAKRGFEIDESTRNLNPDGTTRLVYFKKHIAGFAIHLTCDK